MDGEGTLSTNPLSHDARHADGSVLPSTLSPLPRLHGCWIARGIESRAWIKERSILCPTTSVQWEWGTALSNCTSQELVWVGLM